MDALRPRQCCLCDKFSSIPDLSCAPEDKFFALFFALSSSESSSLVSGIAGMRSKRDSPSKNLNSGPDLASECRSRVTPDHMA